MQTTTVKGQKIFNIAQSVVLGLLMVAVVYFTGKTLVGGFGLLALIVGVGLLGLQIFRDPGQLRGAVELTAFNAPELIAMTRRLAARAGLSQNPRLYLLPSPVANAFTFGRKEGAKIFVTNGLLLQLSERELSGVLAHEISHIRHNDLTLFRMMELLRQLTTLMSRMGWLLLIFAVPFLLLSTASIPVGMLAVLIGAPVLTLLIQLALFRTREFGADIGAVELTGDPRGLASALYKISRPGGGLLSILLPVPQPEEHSLLRTHPATEERIRRLSAMQE